MPLTPESSIFTSWHKNAAAWITAIHQDQIQSRITTTNQLIINTILSKYPKTVLDIGCGEGWLARAIASQGIEVLGVDAIPELIEAAQRYGSASYRVLSYDHISADTIDQRYDVLVCNFSLFGDESVHSLFLRLHPLINADGHLIIQTLHPLAPFPGLEYVDGWRAGSWDGFSEEFSDPAPWYFRTLESWQQLFSVCGYRIEQQLESTHPESGDLLSIVFVAQPVVELD